MSHPRWDFGKVDLDVLRLIERRGTSGVRSPEIARELGLPIKVLRLVLTELSMRRLVKRSKSGVYRKSRIYRAMQQARQF